MRKKLWLVGTLSAAMAFSGVGCTVHTGVRTRTPNLVWVDPGVWVVADYRYPVFYSHGYYWLWRSDTWYRSPRFGRGWSRVRGRAVPNRIRRIDRPRRYRRYQPPRGA
ncbi:MAG: hypothetical protein ACOC5B_02485, partial [Myxococcota bacterium]